MPLSSQVLFSWRHSQHSEEFPKQLLLEIEILATQAARPIGDSGDVQFREGV